MHGKGFAMNAKVLSVLVVGTVLPLAVGCGNLNNWIHGRGAFCGRCSGNAPGYSVTPQSQGPIVGGCGGPACGPVTPEPVCGTEFGGAYLGGYDSGYPIDGGVIGSPAIGTGVYGGAPYDQYNSPSGFMPNNQSYVVPGSQYETEGTQLAPMQAAPMQQSNPSMSLPQSDS